jgi:hypothetical protein
MRRVTFGIRTREPGARLRGADRPRTRISSPAFLTPSMLISVVAVAALVFAAVWYV